MTIFVIATRVASRHSLCARRVEAHSLVSDPSALEAFANPSFRVEFSQDSSKPTWIIQDVPAEEQLESAAARVRPFLLEGEPLFHGQVMKALGYLLHGVELPSAMTGALADLRREWKHFKPRGSALGAYGVKAVGSGLVADNELAFAWLYGDVVHADQDRLEAVAPLSVTERYRAAVPLVCQVVIMVLNTLKLVRGLVARGLLDLPEEPFERVVVVPAGPLRSEGGVYYAPVGTEFPGLAAVEDGPGEGWTMAAPTQT